MGRHGSKRLLAGNGCEVNLKNCMRGFDPCTLHFSSKLIGDGLFIEARVLIEITEADKSIWTLKPW